MVKTIKTKTITLYPKNEFEIIDITSKIKNFIDKILNEFNENVHSNKKINGIINIFVKHTTAALYINENEPNLIKDIKIFISNLIDKNKEYFHNNTGDIRKNGHSHIRSLLFPTSITVPIENGNLNLGTWQSLFYIDFDGQNRKREINLTMIFE